MKSSTRNPRTKRVNRIIIWSLATVLAVLIVSAGWVAIRATMVKDALETVLPLTSKLQSQILASDASGAASTSKEITAKASLAASYSSDVVWRVYENVPRLGVNLTAVRGLSNAIDVMASTVLQPLAKVAGDLNVDAFRPKDGAINAAPLLTVQPAIAQITSQLTLSDARVQAINTTDTIGAIVAAKNKLQAAIARALPELEAVNRATALLPGMLGGTGPRNYLLLVQNPAELRSGGGIPGALALIHAENGRIKLAQQSSTAQFPQYPEPVVPLSPETLSLYGKLPGLYLQNVTMTPHFTETANLAAEMWRLKTGQTVDGVLSIDPIALSYILKATGAITLATGDVIDTNNVVKVLLSDVYERYVKPADQDLFFASAAKSIFETVAEGKFKPELLLSALTQAGDERRILIWSAHPSEQKSLASTTLAGGLPQSTTTERPFGVFLNDATGSKMDYYLSVKYAIGQSVCRVDGRPNYALDITLTNTAPLNAATSLKRYVTGGGEFGVTPGHIRTNISIYAPNDDVQGLKAERDGSELRYKLGFDSGRQVLLSIVELAPGQSTTMRFNFLSESPSDAIATIVSTPLISTHKITEALVLCEF